MKFDDPTERSFHGILGVNLALARKTAGLTQAQLAAKVGIARTTVANIETAYQRINVATFMLLAEACGIDGRDLIPNLPEVDRWLDDQDLSDLTAQERELVESALKARPTRQRRMKR